MIFSFFTRWSSTSKACFSSSSSSNRCSEAWASWDMMVAIMSRAGPPGPVLASSVRMSSTPPDKHEWSAPRGKLELEEARLRVKDRVGVVDPTDLACVGVVARRLRLCPGGVIERPRRDAAAVAAIGSK